MPSNLRPELDTPYQAPCTDVEARIAWIWQDLLEMEAVGMNDDFFQLGGDSLAALEMTLTVEKSIGRTFPSLFFSKPTISYLVELLGVRAPDAQDAPDVESLDAPETEKSSGGLWQSTWAALKRPVISLYKIDVRKIVQTAFYRYLDSKPFLEARTWVLNWSASALVQKLFYSKQRSLLLKVIKEMGGDLGADLLRVSIVNNILSGVYRYLVATRRYKHKGIAALKQSPSAYWASFADLIPSVGEEIFPLFGAEHVLGMRDQRLGIIFLSFHAISGTVPFWIASDRLAMENFRVSYKGALQKSQQWEARRNLPAAVVSSLNVRLALQAVEELRQNGSIHLVADTRDKSGKIYDFQVGGRKYEIKYGFAEFALLTGARAIPYYCGYLPDGRPFVEFCEPLQAGQGTRLEQSENLVRGYAAFVNRIWREHPEVIQWKDMQKHFARPLANGIADLSKLEIF